MVDACICTIGDEILIGQIIDTNSAFISKRLNESGIRVTQKLSVGDDYSQISKTLKSISQEFKVVVITGGLGPTKDDITKKVLEDFSGSSGSVMNQQQFQIIKDIFSFRGVAISELNTRQAMVPDKCTVIPNFKGTAPGMLFKLENGHLLFSLPGVPYEMEAMMDDVIEHIIDNFKPANIYHRTIATYGLPESTLSERIEKWENSLPKEIKLAYLPNPATGIKLRLSSYSGDKNFVINTIDKYVKELKEILPEDIIYGEGETSLEKEVVSILKKQSLTLSVAESCTGGKISSILVSIPGVSSFFKGGFVTYSNSSKINHLGVDPLVLENYGAVSKECSIMMATGCKNRFNTDVALSITGIAGPEGATQGKPVGTVWISVAIFNNVESHTIRFFGDRERNIIRFSSEALNFLRKMLIRHLKA